MANTDLRESIASIRDFNRFYTRHLGVLEEHFLNSPFSLTEARVLYELAQGGRKTAKEIGEALGLDAGYLSRILDRFLRARLITRESSVDDRRQSFIALTRNGAAAFAPLDKRSRENVGAMLKTISERDRSRMITAMKTISSLVKSKKTKKPTVSICHHRPGDLGWIVSRHGALYTQEYGWDITFEAMVADIVAAFVKNYDARCERCWIAEVDGERAGSVMLVRQTDNQAKLRILLVEPHARGHGVGKRLVDECIRFARAAGYKKITLWTQRMLVAARKLYVDAGFRKIREEPHKSFGKKLVGEFWELQL